jgi:hypothetical protein
VKVLLTSASEILQSPTRVVPEVGMAASVITFTDREPVTVVEVIPFKSGPLKGQAREVVVTYDDWKVVSGSEHDGSAVYEYTSNPDGHQQSFVLSTRGRRVGHWLQKGTGGIGYSLVLGYRERYRNPHF